MSDLVDRLRSMWSQLDPIDEWRPVLDEAATEIERLRADAARYRWLRTAGAWESEIGMGILSEDPAKFDAAVDAAMKDAP